MFEIHSESSTAPFDQLRRQIIERVRAGELAVGTRLPTVRSLAATLGIAPNTVARAYRELEADGVIETRGRNGSFVSPHGDATEQQAQLAARAYADRIRQLGIPSDVAAELVARALKN
jgi:DNA-binding transcriptional regulator YhcF (GntR family)